LKVAAQKASALATVFLRREPKQESLTGVASGGSKPLLQLGVLVLGLLVNRDIEVGVFPKSQEILMGRERVARHIGPRQLGTLVFTAGYSVQSGIDSTISGSVPPSGNVVPLTWNL
jgi:hypothetical protein